MASKPSINLPRWADTSPDSGAVVEPPDVKKDTGYQYVPSTTKGEKPIMQHLNWLLLSIYSWIKWVSDNFSLATREDSTDTLTALPNETLVLLNTGERTVAISDTVVDNDIIEIKDAAGTASEITPVIISAPAGYTFEDGSSDAEMQLARACFTFKVFNNKLYLV